MSDDAEVFGPYRLEELLGRGGMGEVWRAFDTRRERAVALKRLSGGWADDDEFRERFRLEARTTARLGSANVIPIHDFGEIDGRLFIDMRLVRGGDLADRLSAHPRGLGMAAAVEIVEQVAGALESAHRDGLVHRDVKPSNVLIESDGVRDVAYLVDFGIAKLALEVTGASMTMTGATLGTPAYMAPELFDGASAAGVASDVYALGCVLYETLTGRRPYSGGHAMVLMNQHLHEPVPVPSAHDPALAPFDAIVTRALAKDPAARPASAAELRLSVRSAAQPPQPAPHTASQPGPQPAPVPGPGTGPFTGPGPVPGDDGVTTIDFGPRRRPWRLGVLVAVGVVVALIAAAGVLAAVLAASGPSEPAAPAAPAAPALAAPERVLVALNSPGGLAISADGRRAFVVNSGAAQLTTLDVATRATLATVGLENTAINEVAVSPDGRRAYVPITGTDQEPGTTVSVVDTTTNAVVARIPVGALPLGVAISPDGRRLYVGVQGTNGAAGTVSVIDTATDAVVAAVPVGFVPERMAVSPDGRTVYVPNANGTNANPPTGTVTAIDTATNTPTELPAGDLGPNDLAITADGRRIYLVAGGAVGTPGSVQVLDTAGGSLAPFPVAGPRVPFDAALAPDGRTLVVIYRGTDDAPDHTVAILDTATRTVRRLVPLPGRPWGVTITRDGREAWVTANQPDELWRLPLP